MSCFARLLSVALLMVSSPAFAQAVAVPDSGGTSPTAASAQVPSPAATQTPSINPSANNAQSSESGAAAANMAAGAALMAACMMTQPPNLALCALGALALMQGANDNNDAGQSGNSATVSSQTPSPTATPATTPTVAPDPTGTDSFQSSTAAGQQALAAAGYTVTPDSVTAPDGTSVPSSQFGTSGGMAQAGFSADQIKAAQKAIADANSKYGGIKVSSVDVADGSGGGGGGNGNGGQAGFTLPSFANPFAINNKAKQALVAGKTVLFDGEPIGVRGDDIFQMVHLAYDRKRQRNSFLEAPQPVSATVRAPANFRPTGGK